MKTNSILFIVYFFLFGAVGVVVVNDLNFSGFIFCFRRKVFGELGL